MKILRMIAAFNTLRKAIRSHDTEAIEAAWLECETWLDMLFAHAGYAWRD